MIPGELIPIVAIVMTFLVPIVGILAYHQRKVAELVHRNAPNNRANEVGELKDEVRALRQLLHQQTIALDNLTGKIDGVLPRGDQSVEVSRRLENTTY